MKSACFVAANLKYSVKKVNFDRQKYFYNTLHHRVSALVPFFLLLLGRLAEPASADLASADEDVEPARDRPAASMKKPAGQEVYEYDLLAVTKKQIEHLVSRKYLTQSSSS